jgi:hypothetical protein
VLTITVPKAAPIVIGAFLVGTIELLYSKNPAPPTITVTGSILDGLTFLRLILSADFLVLSN